MLGAICTAASSFAASADPMAGTVSEQAARTAEARALSAELATKLKAELEAALTAGGPVAALSVCNTVAPSIAGDLSAKFGGSVGRTALKVRNPANTPDAFEKKVLKQFITAAAAGADLTKLEHTEIIEENGSKTFRYMKAIPMAEKPCAACHGRSIDPAVLQKIKELYPADQATGFTPGELRGAFTISKPID